ncbi:MAG: RNA polymerase-binding protein DksA [Gammaproteobacteria bacterium]|nr:RNA polymerase-binding protein DksA [Gammaproteobacteria bacterium]
MVRKATFEVSQAFKPYKIKSGEEYMNATQLRHFRGILQNWRKQLMQEVDTTVMHMRDLEHHADILDTAAQSVDFSIELRTRDRERKLIKKIEKSLDEIDHSDYGYCEDCDAEIGLRRLEARPTATKCIDCKTFAEIREKHVCN